MQFVEKANLYTCKIEVTKGTLTVDAKSIMSVLRLAATKDTVLQIVADGEDAAAAIEMLVQFVESGFGED